MNKLYPGINPDRECINRVFLLTDNGSVRENATKQLRKLAKDLSDKTGYIIHPVSLKHADRIAAEKLAGKPAEIFQQFMRKQLSEGESEFVLLPLFFGESKSLTSFVSDEVDLLKQQFGDFKFDIAEVIYPLPAGEELLTKIIYEHIQTTTNRKSLPMDNIVLVDHGSPNPQVTEVRKHLAKTVQKKLPEDCLLAQAVMERRDDKQYDFNGVLLRDWLLKKVSEGESSAVVILMFFLPGRHAGEGGDIVEICHSVMAEHPGFKISISPLITEHSEFLSLLQKRLNNMI
ncbi:MAG: cobalamin biosynthesis protein CbiX [gamma proteobacterium symbiont of Lucinoma myriamae]|nr:cobalamin biosynthesis protein CbiX [gamma proteobacterium symbiont of Lucinoma myriamae]MCU7819346.1 cobalamin biosynthesis protein CbiX [gamma proteobacterium symbiont of Lucinoma myriamae]